MIVLDANVLIAFLDAGDSHHDRALRILEAAAEEGFGASVLTIAEALVHPTVHGVQDRAAAALADIGLRSLPLGSDDALGLARVRAEYRVRMPDAVALQASLAGRSRLATFDAALASAARAAGVTVIDGTLA